MPLAGGTAGGGDAPRAGAGGRAGAGIVPIGVLGAAAGARAGAGTAVGTTGAIGRLDYRLFRVGGGGVKQRLAVKPKRADRLLAGRCGKPRRQPMRRGELGV